MTNNEKFNLFINSCENPRKVMEALRILAAVMKSKEEIGMSKEERRELNQIMKNLSPINILRVMTVARTLNEMQKEGAA